MVIKRLTIEIDDSPDRSRLTAVPEGVRPLLAHEFKGRELTVSPADIRPDETDSPNVGKVTPKAPGRTISDLIAEFVNDARAMATILMFAPFIVFVAKIQSFSDLVYPSAIGLLLNIIWFGVSWFRRKESK